MKYAVQFAEPKLFGVKDVTVDTSAITFDEAMALYTECRPRFVKAFENEQNAHLVIWEDVGDDEFPNYHTELVDLDTRDELKYIHGNFYKTKATQIKEPV